MANKFFDRYKEAMGRYFYSTAQKMSNTRMCGSPAHRVCLKLGAHVEKKEKPFAAMIRSTAAEFGKLPPINL